MYQEPVIFTDHSTFQVNTRYGTKPKSVFTDTQGREFQVWKTDIAAQLAATMGQSVTVQFEAKPYSDGSGRMNYDVKALLGVPTGVAAAPQAVAPTTAPTTAPVAAPAPPQQNNDAERQLRIMRQKAAGDAIIAFGAAGIDPVVNSAELLEFAQEVLLDFYLNGFSLEGDETVTVDASAAEAGPVA